MILDTSAIVSLFLKETNHLEIYNKICNAKNLAIGSPTLAETGIVLTAKLGGHSKYLLGRFVQENGIFIISFSPDHYTVAIDAYDRFGKGRHKAGLNFGDTMTYAVAKLANQPLLYVGNDFSYTDIMKA